MKISPQASSGYITLFLAGVLNAAEAPKLKSEVQSLTQMGHNRFAFDMSEVPLMDSTGLGALISCLREVTAQGGEMVLVNVQSNPRMVFEVTRTFKLFRFMDAMESVKFYFEGIQVA